jgi:large subunit ribosomal protein L25
MKALTISGSPRVNVGKKDAKALRNEGRVPCVLYGGSEQFHFSVAYNDLLPLVYTPEVHTVIIDINGKQQGSILQDIMFHPVNDKILHVDFLETRADRDVTMEIPVKLVGSAAGVKAGGKLVQNVRKMKVRALPANLPDYITVDVESLEIGQGVRVAEVNLPGVTPLMAPNVVIAAVRMTRAAAAAATEAAKESKKK